ncbi:MAG: putative DNA binding domain-containing protein [Ottowia sp.]|nr:putative DNA binding domain-containing protein [Ottowia sp.]MBP9523876.1 putative DNA binding domain-containing protein [Ottowia sp.]MBP9672830.1 putative DNA binding domain-containing protein [Ottowia sp.]HOP91366.1 ATP-binding protein [Ottowia sp.]HPU11238.1 ATP-binding protein [Ottowia sp.]
MNAQELLESLTLLDENERIEAKRAQDVGKSLLETICAFANEPGMDGGWLLLGVAPDEQALFPGYAVEGVTDPDKLSADIASQCASVFNMPLRVDIRTESLEGKPVIVVSVPEAAPQAKPIYFKSTGLPRGAFRRIGSTDQRCTEDDLEALYASRQHESFDAGLVAGAELDDLDEKVIADYRAARAEANPDAEELRWADLELLQALNAVRRDASGAWKPTVAGLLLFGTAVALRRSFPMTRVDYIRVPGREWVPHPERRFDTVELRAPMFSLLRRIQAAILDDLPKSFGLEEGQLQRSDQPVIPLRALREVLVNALMHRSYRAHAPVQVIRYANRLEIRNPGFSLKSRDHLGEPGSMSRNPHIAAVLHETRFAETKGSGIRAIREAMDKAGLVPPLFESDRGQDQFSVFFFFHHFLGEEDLRWLGQFRDLHLGNEDARALVVAREAGGIDNATYRALNKVDTLTASNALRRLRDAGLLSQQGKGSATWYQPTGKLTKTDGLSSDLGALSSKPEGLSSNPGALSSNPEALSSNLAPARAALLNELPGELAARVGGIGQRHQPDRVRDLVVDLCAHRSWRVDELALLLQRNPEFIRQSYLRPLLAQQRIAMTLPDTPNSPLQAYRIAQ